MKLRGRALYEALKCPKTVVAPMVDQSELAWRIFCRRHGADLCYTPMFNAKLFAHNETYRKNNFSDMDGDPNIDRPLIVQFCANDPDELLAAAKFVEGRCDAVDLNLGCPQGIAKRGHYGSFLMEEWDLIEKLISKLHNELRIPVTAKIRIFDSKEKTLEYAKMILSAGAQILTVHGRTREMKGQQTGLADWSYIRFLRDNLPPNTVLFANGNIAYPEDVVRCLEATAADAVMSAETNLSNPAIFQIQNTDIDTQYPRIDKLIREYFEIAKTTPGRASSSAMKSHFFKLLHSFFSRHVDIRNQLGDIRSGEYDKFEHIVELVEKRIREVYKSSQDVITPEGEYKNIPHWRAQPLFRIVNGVASTGKRVRPPRAVDEAGAKEGQAVAKKKVKQMPDEEAAKSSEPGQ